MRTPRPAHRPRQNPASLRVRHSYSLDPETIKIIADEAALAGVPPGKIVDRLAKALHDQRAKR